MECLVVETVTILESELLPKFEIQLPQGDIVIEGSKEVSQPTLTITERIFAGSEGEARNQKKWW